MKDIASWVKERDKEAALQTPHALFRADFFFHVWVPASLDVNVLWQSCFSYLSLVCGLLGNGGGVHDERARDGCRPQSLHERPHGDGKSQCRNDIVQRQGLKVPLRSFEFLAQKYVLQLQAKPPLRAPHGHDSKRRR